MMPERLLLTLGLLGLAACDGNAPFAQRGTCSVELRELRSDPVEAAERAVATGDSRLLMLRGYTTYVPGIADTRLEGRYRFRILERTSDTPEDESCVEYQSAARNYAERYNARVLELTGARQRP